MRAVYGVSKRPSFCYALLEGKPSMETKMMRKTKQSLWMWTLGACLLFLGMQNAFASGCGGMVYFQAPADWSAAYLATQNHEPAKMTMGDNGFYVANLATWPQETYAISGFSIGDGITTPVSYIDSVNWVAVENGDASKLKNSQAFHCPGDGVSLYIYENPGDPGKTVVSTDPPNAKYFFVMIPPDMDDWMSAVPMLSMDGGVTGKPMTAVPGMCGWYSYVFFNEEISDNAVLFRDDDPKREDMIGVNGNWETAPTAQPIPLGMIFAMGVDTLFFVPDMEQKTNDDGYYYSAADVEGIDGTCSYTLAAVLYDTDPSLHPAFSCFVDGGNGVNNFNDDCQTDPAARQALQNCLGVTQGMIEETLGPDKKPRLKSSGKGPACFQSADLFNQMFNETQGVNEMSCYDMPFKRSADGRWEFDSDYDGKGPNETQGGFAPLEYKKSDGTAMTEAEINAKVTSDGGHPLSAARTRHAAQGPASLYSWLRVKDPVENMPIFDLMCNGPGWTGGLDCDGHFSGGDDLNGQEFYGSTIGKDEKNVWCWGNYCLGEVPADWPVFTKDTETQVKRNAKEPDPRWASGNYHSGASTGALGRNQHFCFESHAQFTYKEGLRFNFRGDDDIWVFIGGKLAVDLGGTHMAAPAYVNLDLVTDAQGNKLKIGEQYDLDIFFCDRRTTMSNVRITTNMYIQQKTSIKVKGEKTDMASSEKTYNLCYIKTGDGSCAAAISGESKADTICGEKLLDPTLGLSYTLVRGNSISSPVEFENVSGGVHNCGIDLSSPAAPKIDTDPKKICGLGGGRYTLYVNIDGKHQKVVSFRMTGDVDVVYANATIVDTTGAPTGAKINLKKTAMAGDTVPVYISNVAPADDGVEVSPEDAVNVEYTLSYDRLMTIFVKEKDPVSGKDTLVKLTSGAKRKIGASGIDTVYATVLMDDMDAAIKEFKVSVAGRENAMAINFYLPKITFIEKIPEEGETAVSVTGQKPNDEGEYEEYWKGAVYDMYLAVLKPNDDGKTYKPCLEECNGLVIHKGVGTSPKIDFVDTNYTFNNGYATISVRSQVEYRWDTNPTIHNPATIVAEYNDYVRAEFTPMYFRDPPVPIPALADVYDVHGSTPSVEYKIPSPYFSMDQEYLDGIGDSVTIYYNRAIHKDSLPTKICLLWDSTSAEEHDPVKEGFSNIAKDEAILCNALLDKSDINIDCSKPTEIDGVSGYCSNVVTLGNVALSKTAKTAGVGKVYSFAVFKDKGKEVKQGFAGSLTDRIAPVPLRAEVRTVMKGDEMSDVDSLVVVMSEPVKLVTTSNRRTSVDFYLNSAIDLAESNRYISALDGTAEKVVSTIDPSVSVNAKTGQGRIKFMYKRGSVSPHVGDYLRLGGNLTDIYWTDEANLSALDGDSLRPASDASYAWNSPTYYKETKRLPSVWIPVVGDANKAIHENKFASTANAPAGDKVPAVSTHAYRTTMTKAEVFAEEGGKPGHFIEADMYALYNGLTDEERESVKAEDMFFYYEVQYYTNLGNFVASKKQKIYCDDSKNTEVDPLTGKAIQYFNGGTCIDAGNDRNYFVGWNMRSDKGRVVGTGAYIVKLNSYVKLGSVGKKAKQESTSVWGIKRSPKPVKDYLK